MTSLLRLLVHGLAQMPSGIRLAVSGASLDPVRALITAYGLDGRIREVDVPSDHSRPLDSHQEILESFSNPPPNDLNIRLADAPLDRMPTIAELVEATAASSSEEPGASPEKGLEGERVAVITNIPNHYRVPLFNALARDLESAGSSLIVLFLGRTYGRRSWVDVPDLDFEHIFLSSVGVKLSRAWHPFIPRDLEKTLRRVKPSIVVCAGFSPLVAGRALRSTHKLGAKFLLWSGETSTGITGSNRLRKLQRRRLLARVDAALSYGSRAEDYLLALRPDVPVIHARNTTPVISAGKPAAETGRPIRLLSVAEARAGKRLDLVIDAAANCMDLDWRLTIVGDGPIRESLEERARKLGERVTFTGAIPSSRVLEHYRESDVFLFPSEIDVFGLVVVEALGSGLCTIVSRAPGATADLCAHERNSLVVPEQTIEAWARHLRIAITDSAKRSALSAAARRTITNRWTIEHSARAFIAGLRAAKGTSQ